MQNSFDAVLLAPQHEEQTYNSCNGILHMCKNQSKLMLEDIAKHVWTWWRYSASEIFPTYQNGHSEINLVNI